MLNRNGAKVSMSGGRDTARRRARGAGVRLGAAHCELRSREQLATNPSAALLHSVDASPEPGSKADSGLRHFSPQRRPLPTPSPLYPAQRKAEAWRQESPWHRTRGSDGNHGCGRAPGSMHASGRRRLGRPCLRPLRGNFPVPAYADAPLWQPSPLRALRDLRGAICSCERIAPDILSPSPPIRQTLPREGIRHAPLPRAGLPDALRLARVR